jgi:Flp pilus assembly pilin Flp
MFKAIARDEAGASGAEYAILLLLLLNVLILGIGALSNATSGLLNNSANEIANAAKSGSSLDLAPTTPSSNANRGRSADAPGHQMQQSGSAPGAPGASGYAHQHKN